MFFSKYIEGSGSNRAVEIYNGTGALLDQAAGGHAVELYANGLAGPTNVVALTRSVAAGDLFVVAHPLAAPALLAQADQTGAAVILTGDGAVVLRAGGPSGLIADVIGRVGEEPAGDQ